MNVVYDKIEFITRIFLLEVAIPRTFVEIGNCGYVYMNKPVRRLKFGAELLLLIVIKNCYNCYDGHLSLCCCVTKDEITDKQRRKMII